MSCECGCGAAVRRCLEFGQSQGSGGRLTISRCTVPRCSCAAKACTFVRRREVNCGAMGRAPLPPQLGPAGGQLGHAAGPGSTRLDRRRSGAPPQLCQRPQASQGSASRPQPAAGSWHGAGTAAHVHDTDGHPMLPQTARRAVFPASTGNPAIDAAGQCVGLLGPRDPAPGTEYKDRTVLRTVRAV